MHALFVDCTISCFFFIHSIEKLFFDLNSKIKTHNLWSQISKLSCVRKSFIFSFINSHIVLVDNHDIKSKHHFSKIWFCFLQIYTFDFKHCFDFFFLFVLFYLHLDLTSWLVSPCWLFSWLYFFRLLFLSASHLLIIQQSWMGYWISLLTFLVLQYTRTTGPTWMVLLLAGIHILMLENFQWKLHSNALSLYAEWRIVANHSHLIGWRVPPACIHD